MKLSRRFPADQRPSALSATLAEVAARDDVIDLREQNPTRCAFAYPHAPLAAALGNPRGLDYDPAPLGQPAARAGISELSAGRVAAEDVVVTASTSEAYALLFKALCDPGDRVAIATPSYPLLEHLAALEAVEVATFRLVYDERWSVDIDALAATLAGTIPGYPARLNCASPQRRPHRPVIPRTTATSASWLLA